MSYKCVLTIYDDLGGIFMERELSSDDAVKILSTALHAASSNHTPDESDEDERTTPPTPSKPKRGRPKKDSTYNSKEYKPVARFAPKPCCGSTGPRHRVTCSQNDVENNAAAYSPDRYGAIRKAMHSRDFSSAEYALTNKLSPREVNLAVKSADYEDYVDSR